MTAPPTAPDYALDAELVVSDPAQVRAALHPLRSRILHLLAERAATISELAEALERPPGTVGHHVTVLLDHDLIREIRTAQVRGITARWYGRRARTYVFGAGAEAGLDVDGLWMLAEASREVDDEGPFQTLRHARLSPDDRAELEERLLQLAEEFAGRAPTGDDVHGLVIALYRTPHRGLPTPHGD